MAESSNSSSAGPPAAKKRRIPIKDSQRKALRVWYNDDSNGKQSIETCGHWSGSEPSGDEWSDSRELMTPIVTDLIAMERQGQIRERMNIQSFLNPITEEVHDQEEDIFEAIIARHGEEREAESDEEVEEVPRVSVSEALSALRILQTHEEQQKLGDPALTKALRKHERELQLRKTVVLRQSNLGSWLGAK